MELYVVASPETGEDSGEAAVWAARLSAELSELDDVSVAPITEDAPEGSKGVGAATGALFARLTGVSALKELVETLRRWATRTGRTVEVSIDGDLLKLTGASREQQDLVVEAWIARHRSGA